MSIKLFIEMGEPKRALLIMSTTDMLECKIVGASAMRYDTGTFSGELRVKDIPWERLDPGFIEKIKKDLDFPTVADATDLMEKIHNIIPESKPDEPPKIISKLPLVVTANNTSEIEDVDTVVKEIAKTESVDVSKTTYVNNNVKGQPAAKPPEKAEKPIIVKSLADLKTAINQPATRQLSKKERKKLEEQNRQRQIAQAKLDKERLTKAVTSNTPQSVKKEEPKNVIEEAYIKTVMEKHPTGFTIAVKFNNKEGHPELLIVSTPQIDGKWETSLPMIFATKASAEFVFEALLRHPRYNKLMGGRGEVIPIADIDKESRGMEVALIKNGLSFVNSISK